MPLHLTIVTPEGRVFDGDVDNVVVPGAEGDFGVLEGHERFLAPVKIGELEIRGAAGGWAATADGFAQVDGERVVLMVDSCELARDIDVARAERARSRAEREIGLLRENKTEDNRLLLDEAALKRAIVRISVAEKHF